MCDEHVEARAGALRQARGTLSVRDEFDQATDIVGCLGLCEVRVIGRNVGQDETDDLIVTSAAGEIAAFTSDLSEHFQLLSIDPTSNSALPGGQSPCPNYIPQNLPWLWAPGVGHGPRA